MKPLKGDTFKVDIEPEQKVSDLKEKVEKTKSEFPAAQQKLIFNGKILNDNDVIKDLDIKPEAFIVVMVTKATPPPERPAPAAATTQPEASATNAPSNPEPTTGTTDTPMAAATPTRPLPQIITALRSNPRFRELAQTVARNPAVLARMLPALQQNHRELMMAIRENGDGFIQMCREEVGMGGGGMGGAQMMAQMMQQGAGDPRMRAVAQMLAQNPQMLQQMMQEDPELAAALQANPQALQGLLQAAGNSLPGQGAGGPQQIVLSQDDRAAIERLCALGFDRNLAAQAYLACDKNEELAANFLLEGGGEGDDGA